MLLIKGQCEQCVIILTWTHSQNAVLKWINLGHKWTLLEVWLSSSFLSFLCLSQAITYLAILVCTGSVWRRGHTVHAEESHSQRSSRAHHRPLLSSCPHIHTAQSHWNSPHDTPHDLSSYWGRYLTWEEQKDTEAAFTLNVQIWSFDHIRFFGPSVYIHFRHDLYPIVCVYINSLPRGVSVIALLCAW